MHGDVQSAPAKMIKSKNTYLLLLGLCPLSMPMSVPNLDGPLSSDLSPFSESNKCLSRLSEARYGPKRKNIDACQISFL